jgi:antitoxin component YwqK of YwqJK toxin-antitoxin module
MILNKLFLIISVVFLLACNYEKNPDYTSNSEFEETTELNENSCPKLPNCNDSSGLCVQWRAGLTSEVIRRKDFLKQIPNNYSGVVKLCGENCIDGSLTKGLLRLIKYKNGKIDGLCYEFDCDGGFDEQYYKYGIPEGTWVHYNTNGLFDFVRNFKNGKLDGEYLLYDSQLGRLREKCFYKGDSLDGEYISFWENQRIKEKSLYKNGDKVGKSTTYFENGLIEHFEVKRNDGSCISKYFYGNGQLRSVFEYKPKLGIIKIEEYDVNGKLISTPKRTLNISRPK